jgi:hypothetical protein
MKTVNEMVLRIKDFSSCPGPRYIVEGEYSGEQYRKEILEPRLRECIQNKAPLTVDLDGTAGYGTSFLEEAFGGLIRKCEIELSEIKNVLILKSDEEPYLIEDIENYMKEASNEKH